MSCGGVEINPSRGIIPCSGLGSVPGSIQSLCQSQFLPALPSSCILQLVCIPRARLQPYLCRGILGIPAGSSGQGFGGADRVGQSRNQSGFSMEEKINLQVSGTGEALSAKLGEL